MTSTPPLAWDDEHDALLLDALDQAMEEEAAYSDAATHHVTWEEATKVIKLPPCPEALEVS